MGEVEAMSGKQIRASLDELMQACDVIEGRNCCTECPLEYNCLREDSTEDLWGKVSEVRINSFLDFADNIDEILEERAEREQREYEEEMAELTRGYFRDRI